MTQSKNYVIKRMLPLHAKVFLSYVASMKKKTMSDVILELSAADIKEFMNNASRNDLEVIVDAYNDFLDKKARAAFTTRKEINRNHVKRLIRYADAVAIAARKLLGGDTQ